MEKRTLYKEGTYKKGNLHTHTTWSDGMQNIIAAKDMIFWH